LVEEITLQGISERELTAKGSADASFQGFVTRSNAQHHWPDIQFSVAVVCRGKRQFLAAGYTGT
jgi:hypothetical protein